MTNPATAIRMEIRELINLQIQVFGQSEPLTPSELEECHHRAEQIRLLGKELDEFGFAAIQQERWRRAS